MAGEQEDGDETTHRERTPAPRWLFHLFLTALALWLLWGESFPGGDYEVLVTAAVGLAAAAIFWLVWLVAVLISQRRSSWWFVVAPIGGLLTLGLIMLDVPLQARFLASESALDEARLQVTAQTAQSPHGRIGLYSFTESRPLPGGGAAFFERDGGYLSYPGFMYLPGGVTDAVAGQLELLSYEHLDGDWYVFFGDW